MKRIAESYKATHEFFDVTIKYFRPGGGDEQDRIRGDELENRIKNFGLTERVGETMCIFRHPRKLHQAYGYLFGHVIRDSQNGQ